MRTILAASFRRVRFTGDGNLVRCVFTGGAHRLSTTNVTGPSLTNSTIMWARKRPVATGMPCSATVRHEDFVKLLGQLGRRGGIERRPPPLAAIARQRELTDHKHGAAHLADREVHLSLRIVEDPQRDDLLRQFPRVGLLVALDHSQQNQQSPLDPPADFSLYGDLGTGDTLKASEHSGKRGAGSGERGGL